MPTKSEAPVPTTPKTIVMVFGVFDILHPGHLAFFEQARHYGDELVVVVTPDAKVLHEKGRAPACTTVDRIAVLSALSCVDRVLKGDDGEHWTVVERVQPDVICVGHDQHANHPAFIAQLDRLAKKPKILTTEPINRDVWSSSRLRTER